MNSDCDGGMGAADGVGLALAVIDGGGGDGVWRGGRDDKAVLKMRLLLLPVNIGELEHELLNSMTSSGVAARTGNG